MLVVAICLWATVFDVFCPGLLPCNNLGTEGAFVWMRVTTWVVWGEVLDSMCCNCYRPLVRQRGGWGPGAVGEDVLGDVIALCDRKWLGIRV